MATTTNYGWTTPDDTALVKDGAAAIRALGTAIDTSMNTALGTKKAGLVLLNTTSFSAVSSFSFTASTFSSTYSNYRIILNIDSSAASAELDFRLRVGGVDNSSANYAWLRYGIGGSSAATNNSSSGTSLDTKFRLCPVSGTYSSFQIMDIFRPFDTDNTGYTAQGFYFDALASNWSGQSSSGISSVTTSYDALTFIVSTGTMTGSYSIYGYNK